MLKKKQQILLDGLCLCFIVHAHVEPNTLFNSFSRCQQAEQTVHTRNTDPKSVSYRAKRRGATRTPVPSWIRRLVLERVAELSLFLRSVPVVVHSDRNPLTMYPEGGGNVCAISEHHRKHGHRLSTPTPPTPLLSQQRDQKHETRGRNRQRGAGFPDVARRSGAARMPVLRASSMRPCVLLECLALH